MRLKKVLGIASVMMLMLAADACASSQNAKVADASAPKPKPSTLHRYDPFTDPFDSLNNPAISYAPNMPRRPGSSAGR